MAGRLTPFPFALVALVLVGLLEPPPAHSGAPGRGHSIGSDPPEHGAPGHRHCRICRHAEKLGLSVVPLVRPTVTRCPIHVAPMTAALPRGRVRPEALATLRLDAGVELFDERPDLDTEMPVEFRLGKAVVARIEAFPIDRFSNRLATGTALRERLQGLRGRICWGDFALADRQARGSFFIDPPDRGEAARLQEVDLAVADEPLWVRHVLRGYAELEAMFDMAALERAQEALARRPGEPHAMALAWYAYGLLELRGLEEAQQLQNRIYTRPRGRRAEASCRLHDPGTVLPRGRPPRSGTCGG